MGQYAGAVVTTAGLNMIASAIAAQDAVTFTAVEASSEALAPGVNLESLVSLNDVEQTVTPTNVGVYNGNIIQLIANFENSTVAADYSMETLGVWAQQGSQTPVLFAVIKAITPDVMPEASPIAPTSVLFRIQMTVTNADQVTVQVVAAGAATVADLALKLDKADVYNALDQTAAGYALDARQGAALDGRLDSVESYVSDHDTAILNGSILTYAESFTVAGLYPFVTTLTTTDLPGSSTYYTQANGFCMYRQSTNPSITLVLFGRDDSIWLREKSGGDPWGSWVQMLDTGEAASTYVPKTDIVNGLNQSTAGKVLDASQGADLKTNSLYRYTAPSGDVNNLTDYGTWYIYSGNSYTNLPSGVSYGTMVVWNPNTQTSLIEQMLIVPGTPVQVHVRDTVDGGVTWRAWSRLAHASELSAYLATANVYNGLDQSNAGYALDARQASLLMAKAGSTGTGVFNFDGQTASIRLRYPWAKGTKPTSTVYRNIYFNSNSANADVLASLGSFVQASGAMNLQLRANRNVAGSTTEPTGIDIVNPQTGAGEVKVNINGTQYGIKHEGNTGVLLTDTGNPITTSTTNRTVTGISNYNVFIGQLTDSQANGIMVGYRFSATQITFLGISGANTTLHMSRLVLTMSGDKITSVAGALNSTATGLIRITGIV